MKLRMKLVLGLAVLSLGLTPAAGMAVTYTPEGPDYHPDTPKGPKYDPDKPKPGNPPGGPKGKAYGYYCKGQSKKHVKGEKGTPFSRCVKGVNQMRREQAAAVTSSSVA